MDQRRPKKQRFRSTWFKKPAFKIALALFIFGFIVISGVGLHYYRYYSALIDRRLDGEVFQRTASLYAVPYHIYSGQDIRADQIIARLQRAGFEPQGSDHTGAGVYELQKDVLKITSMSGEEMTLRFGKDSLTSIKAGKKTLGETDLPAELVTSLSDDNRQKRRLVDFQELPPNLIHALIAAEDNRFYSHHGIDPIRLAGALFQSRGSIGRMRGTSTITQQLSRNFFLTTSEPSLWLKVTRKINEVFVSLVLEQRLTKEQILTYYSNDVYLGARGSFSIKGFGEGAAAYFGKDLTALTLPEAATLASIIPAPSGTYSPIRHPDNVKNRRNLVLDNMVDLGFITPEEAGDAKLKEIELAPFKVDTSDAPYLVDYIHNSLLRNFSEEALNNDGLKIQTTLDPDLQNAAVVALVKNLKDVNEQVAQRNKSRKADNQLPEAQGAVIVLDRKTAGIRAMAGGGDYGVSQLNRVTQAFRQPGSIFKPLVYAAAFEECERLINENELDNSPVSYPTSYPVSIPDATDLEVSQLAAPPLNPRQCITPATIVDDSATVFTYDDEKTYEPNNYHEKYNGPVTVRYALEHSLNVPTIKIAEAIGYDKVADLAKRAGLNGKIKGYPSVALGAFEVTPLEMAGAYTMFANEGVLLEPHALVSVSSADGTPLHSYSYPETQVLSPQVTYLMTSLMQGVIFEGTGASVRSRGFTIPAAGKTGTSRDGWFAGYTKDYIVIAWVGFDDNSDLNIEGAHSALPIWTDFMLKAAEIYPPRNMSAMAFEPPEGIVETLVERDPHEPPVVGCEEDRLEAFIAGSVVPPVKCSVVEEPSPVSGVFQGLGRVLGRLFGRNPEPPPPPTPPSNTPGAPSTSSH